MRARLHTGWTLFRQDPAIRTLSVSCSIALLMGLSVVGYRGMLPTYTHPGYLGEKAGWLEFSIGVVWFLLMMLVATVKIAVRSGLMSLALPIGGRTLWSARMAAVLTASLLPLAVLTAVVALRDSVGGAFVLDAYMVGVGALMVAGLVLTVFLLQQPFAGLHRIEWGWAYAAYGLLMAVLVLLVILASPVSWPPVVLMLAAACALAIGVYRRLPASLLVADTAVEGEIASSRWGDKATALKGTVPFSATREREGARARGHAGGRVGSARWFRDLTAWRLLVNQWQTWLFLLGLFAYGFLLAEKFYEGQELLPFVLFPAAWAYGVLGTSAQRISYLDPLPVSRRQLFLYPAVTALTVLALGIGTAEIRQAAHPHPPRMINYFDHEMHVPEEFCEIAWDGVVPEVTSPWGEHYTPEGHRVLPWSPAVVYDPFEHGRGNSPEFVALQIDRGIEAVHGVPVPARYTEPGFRLPDSYVDAIRRGAFTVEGSVGRASEGRSRTVALGALVFLFLLVPIYSVSLAGQSATPRGAVCKWTSVGILVAVLLLITGAVVVQTLGFTKVWAVGALPWILLRHLAAALPVGTSVLWILFLAAAGASYFILVRVFERIEAPLKAKPSGFEQEY